MSIYIYVHVMARWMDQSYGDVKFTLVRKMLSRSYVQSLNVRGT